MYAQCIQPYRIEINQSTDLWRQSLKVILGEMQRAKGCCCTRLAVSIWLVPEAAPQTSADRILAQKSEIGRQFFQLVAAQVEK